MYIGSSVILSMRFLKYFNEKVLLKTNMMINSAILKHKLNNFSLDILEYCDLNVVIRKQQDYLNQFKPEYNILRVAGSSLGYLHTEETLNKLKYRVVSLTTHLFFHFWKKRRKNEDESANWKNKKIK